MDKTQKNELVDERVKLFEENKRAIDTAGKEKRELNTDEQKSVDERFARIDAIKRTLESNETLEAEERALGESRGRKTTTDVSDHSDNAAPARVQALAFRGWLAGPKHATPEMREAMKVAGIEPAVGSIDMASLHGFDERGNPRRDYVSVRANSNMEVDRREMEQRVLSIGTTTAGGNSVPNEMMRAFTENLKWFGAIRELSQVIQTETGATLPWPTITDTSNTGEILAEATAATTTADPTFGVVNIGAYKFSSKAVIVSVELIQDSFFDLSSWLGKALGMRLGRIQNNKFTVGAGTTEPKGLITGATTQATIAAATNAFTPDDVIALIHAVDKAYRNLPGAGFVAHDTTLKNLRLFKDGVGRYMWQPAYVLGQPDTILGYPIATNNDMDSALTAGKKLLGFGHAASAHVIRDAGATRFVRTDEKYVLEHQVAFLAWQRASSETVDSTAFKVLTLS